MPLAPSLSDLEVIVTNEDGNHVVETHYNGLRQSVDDQPAMIINHGEELRWYHQDQLHRPEHLGPAVINKDKGIENYFLGGQMHRVRGPALITPTSEKWIKYNHMHRADGPASTVVIDGHTQYQWWYNGRIYSSFEVWAEENNIDPEVYTLLKLEFG